MAVIELIDMQFNGFEQGITLVQSAVEQGQKFRRRLEKLRRTWRSNWPDYRWNSRLTGADRWIRRSLLDNPTFSGRHPRLINRAVWITARQITNHVMQLLGGYDLIPQGLINRIM